MLKSTYRPVSAASTVLPEGWTEYTAPTGQKHYYNSLTKECTYARPQAQSTPLPSNAINRSTSLPSSVAYADPNVTSLYDKESSSNRSPLRLDGQGELGVNSFQEHGGLSGPRHNSRNSEPKDRATSKHVIPQCEPWLLVKTKLGRRFVYNPEQGQSFWKFPPEVLRGVVEHDRQEREKRQKLEDEKDEFHKVNNVKGVQAQLSAPEKVTLLVAPRHPSTDLLDIAQGHESESEYEEVDITDDENEEISPKRAKFENAEAAAPAEFNEDDIAYQLEAMGHDYCLDPEEYGADKDSELEEGAEGLPLTEADANALFKDMLDDYQINPYTPWEILIEAGQIIEDDRYIVLPNMRSRKVVWSDWSKERIKQSKVRREKEEKKDPKIPYFAFLEARATPKLYWPEFRRKYQREPEMRNAKITERDREKWYREYINRLKLSESTLKADLLQLLHSIPLHALNRSTTLEALPIAILTDLRFVSLKSSIRNGIVGSHILSLPLPPEKMNVPSEEEREARSRETVERKRRESALAQRQIEVQQKKRKQQEALAYSKGILREGEQLIERAMKVGKDGLLGHIQGRESTQANENFESSLS